MKKQIISSIALIMIAFMLGLTNYVGATNTNIENENAIVENEVINTTDTENNTDWYGVNTAPADLVNELQNENSVKQKDNRKSVAVTIIIIITIAVIAILVGWYYMTNQ